MQIIRCLTQLVECRGYTTKVESSNLSTLNDKIYRLVETGSGWITRMLYEDVIITKIGHEVDEGQIS